MRISDWSSDVCSSDLLRAGDAAFVDDQDAFRIAHRFDELLFIDRTEPAQIYHPHLDPVGGEALFGLVRKIIAVAIGDNREVGAAAMDAGVTEPQSEAHTTELQSLLRISYAVIYLTKQA